MTETLSRPSRPSPRPPRRAADGPVARSPLAGGSAAAVWAVAAGLLCICLPVLLFWTTDERSGAGAAEAIRSGARLWLLAHGVNLELSEGSFALTPLGLTLLPIALLARFAATAARSSGLSSLRAARSLVLVTAVPYAVLVALVAAMTTDADVHVSPVQALFTGLVVGALGALLGALRVDRLRALAREGLPLRARRLAVAGSAAAALLLGAGALLVGVSLAWHLDSAAELAGVGSPGPLGGLALLLACLALVPNAVVWGASWLAGPGFAVGVGTAVGPFGHELGSVPALPLLAALPANGVPGWAGALSLLVPLAAGAVAGRLVLARLGDDLSALRTALEAAAAGPACAVLIGLLAWLSGGAAGGDRLVEVGPSAWTVALAVGSAVAVGAAAAALLGRRSRTG